MSHPAAHHPCSERARILLGWLPRTKLNLAALPLVVSCTVISKCGLKSLSVALDGSPGKYSCVVSIGWFGACTLTCKWRVRPG